MYAGITLPQPLPRDGWNTLPQPGIFNIYYVNETGHRVKMVVGKDYLDKTIGRVSLAEFGGKSGKQMTHRQTTFPCSNPFDLDTVLNELQDFVNAQGPTVY